MRWGIWPAFLTLVFVTFGLLGLWDMTWLAFKTLDFIRNQIQEEPLKPPAAPSWTLTEPTDMEPVTGRLLIRDDTVRAIPLKDEGIMALGIDQAGDYAPLIMQQDGAVRAAGKWRDEKTGKYHWVALRVDAEGRLIVSPESFWGLNLAPGETITIHAPTPDSVKVKRR